MVAIGQDERVGPEDDPDEQDDRDFIRPGKLVVGNVAHADLQAKNQKYRGEHHRRHDVGRQGCARGDAP